MIQKTDSSDDLIREMINDVEQIRKINSDLVRRGPMDTAAQTCLNLSKKILALAKKLGYNPEQR